MNELLKMILSLSLSGSLLILVLLLFKPVIKNKLSKRWQYYIWLIVVARLLLPFAPETNLIGTLFRDFDNFVVQTTERTQLQPSNSEYPETDYAGSDQQDGNPDGEYTQAGKHLSDKFFAELRDLEAICLAIWLIGAVGLMIRKVTVYQSFVKYVNAGRLDVSDMALWEQVGKLVAQTGVKEAVGLYTNSLIASPLLIGFFRPCIMLPTTALSDSDFQYTILHELTHYKRRDMFYKWLVQFTVCLHWFNPLVYFMSREVNRNCELSCDEAIIRTLDAKQRQAYGDTLLNAVGTGGSYKDSVSSVTLSENKERLKERLDAIMDFQRKTKMTAAISTALAVTLCFGATVAGAYPISPRVNQNDKTSVKGTVAQLPDVSGSPVISLSSGGQGSITQSGSFEAKENQALILTVRSNIQGGTVDFFLFSPNGKEKRFTFTGADKTESIALSAGVWAYNCTGFFKSGTISISGELKNANSGGTEKTADAHEDEYSKWGVQVKGMTTTDAKALELMQKTGNWAYIEPLLPQMTDAGMDAVVRSYNSKHFNPAEYKKASDYYNAASGKSKTTPAKKSAPFDYTVFSRMETLTPAEADALALSYIAATGQFGHIYNLKPYMTTVGIDAAVKAYLDADGDVGVVLAMLPDMSSAAAKAVKAQALNEW